MTRICWWLVDIASRMLHPDERDAVSGDFAESGESGGRALRGVLDLIVRRQVALWKDWRPWSVLIGLVWPAGILLTQCSFRVEGSWDLYFWIFRNRSDFDPAILLYISLTMEQCFVDLLCGSLLLGALSWSSGFVVGLLTRRTISIHGAALYLVLLLGTFWKAQLNLHHYLYDVSGGIFPLEFYTGILPFVLCTILILLPLLSGTYQSRKFAMVSTRQMMLLTAPFAIALVAQSLVWWQGRTWNTHLLWLGACWPIVYTIASESWRGALRLHTKWATRRKSRAHVY